MANTIDFEAYDKTAVQNFPEDFQEIHALKIVGLFDCPIERGSVPWSPDAGVLTRSEGICSFKSNSIQADFMQAVMVQESRSGIWEALREPACFKTSQGDGSWEKGVI